MYKIKINRKLFVIHSWVSLLLGLLYLLISISGASVVFKDELNQLIYGNDIKIEKRQGEKISYDEIYAIANKEYPKSLLIRIGQDPVHKDNGYSIMGFDGVTNHLFTNRDWHTDYLNPYTGEIIFRTNSSGTGNILNWLDSLHVSLRIGAAGRAIVALLSVAMLISLLTGFLIYRKHIIRVLLFRNKMKLNNWRRATSNLHRVVGVWAFLFNMLIFGSGLYMVYPLLTPKWWKGYLTPRTEVLVENKMASLDTMVLKANQMIPEMSINFITVSRAQDGMVSIQGPAKEKLFLYANNYPSVRYKSDGTLIGKTYKSWNNYNRMEKWNNINFSIFHTGWAFGLFGKILWTIFGFTPAFLSITGFILWWRRKTYC